MIPIFILAVCFVHTLCASADSDALVTSKAYLDISIGDKAVGKIVIGLFGKTAPKTVKNFEALASHEVSKNYFGSENMRHRIFFSERAKPNNFVYGVIVTFKCENILLPVPRSFLPT